MAMSFPTEGWIVLSGLIGGIIGGGFALWITKLNLAHEKKKLKAEEKRFYNELNHKRRMEFMESNSLNFQRTLIAASGAYQLAGDMQKTAFMDLEKCWMSLLEDTPKAHLYLAKDELDMHQETMNTFVKFLGNMNVEDCKSLGEKVLLLTFYYKVALGIEASIPDTRGTLYPGGEEEFARFLKERYASREESHEVDGSG